MNHFKKRVALFLCLVLVLPSVIGCLPSNTLIAQAAGSYTRAIYCSFYPMQTWDENEQTYTYSLELEAGQKVNMGALFYYHDSNGVCTYLSNLSSGKYATKYTSSKTKVATINSTTGVLTAKAKGTTTITIKYKGVSATCKVKVVGKGAFGVAWKDKSKAKSIIKEINSVYKGKLTASNLYKINQLLDKLQKHDYSCTSLSSGFVYDPTNWYTTNKLAVPEWAEASNLSTKLYEYARSNNPIGTLPSAFFKIKSVSAKGNSRDLTINLKSKVDTADIFAIHYMDYGDDFKAASDRAVFNIILEDTKTGYRYYGRAIATKGSSKISVNMDYLKLVKNRKYKLMATDTWYDTAEYGWTKGFTFTAK